MKHLLLLFALVASLAAQATETPFYQGTPADSTDPLHQRGDVAKAAIRAILMFETAYPNYQNGIQRHRGVSAMACSFDDWICNFLKDTLGMDADRDCYERDWYVGPGGEDERRITRRQPKLI